jgi:hypothetical protein
VDNNDQQHSDVRAGKRGEVRNNSGLPVDHSGPGLRVGPTTPATTDRKSEACPPDSDGVGVGVGVAVDLAVEGAHSQRKSGRESESGALSGASEASDVLRSAATQRGSSLVLNQSNRYENAVSELRARGRKRYCGARTLRGHSLDGQAEKAIRLDCKTWDCAYCGPRKAWRYKQAIRVIAERHSLTRFLTLTLDPSKIEGDPVRYLRRVFNKFRVSLLRKFKCTVTYIAILEFHKSGIPHLHVLIDRYVRQQWISESWSALGGGGIVDIRHVDVHRISHYLAKYLTKELLMSAPLRSRRVTTSRSIHLLEKTASDTTWVMDGRSIFHLFSIFGSIAQDVQVDCDGFLFSFSLPVGIDTPPWHKQQLFITLTLVRTRNGVLAVFLMW